jgi:hypothetical protein
MVQPAWASDGIQVSLPDLQRMICYDTSELPLTRLRPVQATRHGYLTGIDPAQSASHDVEALGTPARTGGKDYAWSISVRAPFDFDFALPAAARRIETLVGIDERAGNGGCASSRLEVLVAGGAIGSSVDSPLLRGSRSLPARLSLELPANLKPNSRVRLVTDSQSVRRPAGADPLEIRDFVDWLEPVVVLDQVRLAREVRQAWPAAIGPLADWALDGDWQPVSQWRPSGRPRPGFRQEITLGAEPFRMSRELHITGDQSHFWIYASRLAGKSSPIDMRCSIDGYEMARREVPIDEQLDIPLATIVDLSPYAGRAIRIEIVFRRRGEPASFELLGAGLGSPPKSAAGQ